MSVNLDTIKYDFFDSAVAGLIKSLTDIIKPFSKIVNRTVPVYVANTGDEVYLELRENTLENVTKDNYKQVPRLVVDIAKFAPTVNFDQLTSRHANGTFTTQNTEGYTKTYVAEVRRIPITLPVNVRCTFSNIFEIMTFINVYLNYSYKIINFEFSYLGRIQDGSFEIPEAFAPEANTDLSHDTQRRNYTLDMQLDIQLQLPAYNFENANEFGQEVLYPELNISGDGFIENIT